MPSKNIVEDQWPGGWTPSTSEVGNLGQNTGLLRMDNLTLDERQTLRISKGYRRESVQAFQDVKAIFSTVIQNYGVFRYVYGQRIGTTQTLWRNVANPVFSAQDKTNITAPLTGGPFTTATADRAAFLSVLGHVFICIGSYQYKDRGDLYTPLGVPAPTAPTTSLTAPPNIVASNLDGGGFYTNWTAVEDATFTNAGAYVQGTPSATTNRLIFQTTFSSPIDLTNFGSGTGQQADNDLFSFNFTIDDASQLNYVRIEFFTNGTPPAFGSSTPGYFYWKEWDFANNYSTTTYDAFGNPVNNNPYPPFPVSSAVKVSVVFPRSSIFDNSTNKNPADNWSTIKTIRIGVGTYNSATITFDTLTVTGGVTSQMNVTDITYEAVAVNNTGSFLEFSPASVATASIDNTANYKVTVTPAGAVDAQANQYWLFRKDKTTGEYLLANIQTGAYGFTPAAFVDGRNSNDLISDAAINPQYILQPYRTALPTNIIDMIFFRDRIIYLTPTSFIPSYELDPGSYDSRWVYDIAGGGGNSETCLFIVKIDVGNFLIATTKDFYRVNGTFTIIVDSVTGVPLQDVNIYPLGIKDPAISHAFAEVNGAIHYLSSTGIRVLSNYASTLINNELDLLFRRETRHGVSPIRLAAADQSTVACVSSGNRVYWSLPHYDGVNRVYVMTLNQQVDSYQAINSAVSWRLWTKGDYGENPTALCREEDGTILFAGLSSPTNYLYSLETGQYAFLPVHFKTAFNYGGSPDTRKDPSSLKLAINTNNNSGHILIYGLGYDGSIRKILMQFIAWGDTILEIDLKTADGFGNSLGSCLAYALEISCYTDYFELSYWDLSYDPRPPLVRRAIVFSDDFENAGLQRVEAWPFLVNLLGNVNNVLTAYLRQAGVQIATTTFNGTSVDSAQLMEIDNSSDRSTFAGTWELELVASDTMEVYKIHPPVFSQKRPTQIQYAIKPFTNFGKASPKKIATWPLLINTLGNTAYIKVTADSTVYAEQQITSSRIETLWWLNNNDLNAVDWQIEVYTKDPTKFIEFYGFGDPVIQQAFPVERTLDSIGPFEMKAKGLITGFRLRVWPTNATISYVVYEGEVSVVSDSLTVTINKDDAYIVTLPKGVDPSVCRILLTSANIFYRFSFELRLTQTGTDTEEIFFKV